MILYCCQDLIFATKIRSTAESLGVPTQALRDADALPSASNGDEGDADGQSIGAIMVDLELGEDAMTLIERARQNLPTAAVIAFGSHVAKDVLDGAKARGAHHVLPRSAFTQQLPDLLQKYNVEANKPRET